MVCLHASVGPRTYETLGTGILINSDPLQSQFFNRDQNQGSVQRPGIPKRGTPHLISHVPFLQTRLFFRPHSALRVSADHCQFTKPTLWPA